MVLPQLIAEIICQGMFLALFGGTAASSKPPTKISPPAQRRSNQLIKCAVEGCNALAFRSTDYCWKHQDEPPLDSEPNPEQESNWWEDNSGE